MSDAPAAPSSRISAAGWLAIALRLLAMLALLLLCAPLYYLWRLLRLPRFWPRVFLGGVGLIAGLEIKVEGRAHPSALLLSNHVSWLDIPAIAQATGSAFVAHSGLASVPLIRHLCSMNDTVFVDRHRRASVARQVEQVRRAISEIGALTIFPEGTTGDGAELLPFKTSLLSAAETLPMGVAVQPVYLDYTEAAEIAWVGDEPGADNFMRILARLRPLRLTVHFLPPLEGAALASRKTMAAAAEQAIRDAMSGSPRA